MADDDGDDLAQNSSQDEDDDPFVRRWQRKLEAMTPHERERATASLRASLGGIQDVLVANSAVKVNVDYILAQQRQIARSMGESLARNLRASIPPTAGFLPQNFPASVDFSEFEELRSQISAWVLEQSGVWEALKGLSETIGRWVPQNLRGLHKGGLEQVSNIVCDDGIPLYGAPRQEIVVELLAAPDLQARRGILGARASEISLDCRELLETCASDWSRSMTPFALEALDSFDEGRIASAQALGASIIDTLLHTFYGKQRSQYTPSKANAKNPRTVETLESLPFRQYLAISPIWQTHQQFWVDEGDPIPKTFNRNASAHAVSAEQYTLINGVQSLLFSSTLLWFIDQEKMRLEESAADQADGE